MRSMDKEKLDELKYETARELGINMKRVPGERMSARDAGRVGGNMVRKMIKDYERTHKP